MSLTSKGGHSDTTAVSDRAFGDGGSADDDASAAGDRLRRGDFSACLSREWRRQLGGCPAKPAPARGPVVGGDALQPKRARLGARAARPAGDSALPTGHRGDSLL